MAKDSMRLFTGPEGTHWGVEVKMPTASNAMVVFHHPGGRTAGMDRYSWYQWRGPEARSVTSRVAQGTVMKALSEDAIALLFRRSMPITAGSTPISSS